jgi:hypothetical protein
MNAADNGTAADLSCRGIQQKLNGTAKGNGALGADEEATESEAVHVGDVASHAGLPGDEEGSRRTDARIFAQIGSDDHNNSWAGLEYYPVRLPEARGKSGEMTGRGRAEGRERSYVD